MDAGLSLFLLKGKDKEVGTHKTEYRTQDWKVVWPYTTPGDCDLLCSKHTTPTNRTLGCLSFLAASDCWCTLNSRSRKLSNLILPYATLAGLNDDILCSVGFFGPKFRCLHYPYSHLFVQSSRQICESLLDSLVWVCGLHRRHRSKATLKCRWLSHSECPFHAFFGGVSLDVSTVCEHTFSFTE